MSSFVISKKDYVKVGGFIAALQSYKVYHESLLYWFNYEFGKLHDDNSIYYKAVEYYHLNAKSVQMQYNDPEPENDDKAYLEEFRETKRKMMDILEGRRNSPELRKAIANYIKFVGSVNYQIEDTECNDKVMKDLNFIARKLCELLLYSEVEESECWGDFTV